MVDHSHDPVALCREINDILKHQASYDNYLKNSTSPLSAIATTNAALTITSLLLLLNSQVRAVKIISAINLILLLLTTLVSIFFMISLYRANFRLSRAHYRVNINNYTDKKEFTTEEEAELIHLVHLARAGRDMINTAERLYQNFFWKYFFTFSILAYILLVISIILHLIL